MYQCSQSLAKKSLSFHAELFFFLLCKKIDNQLQIRLNLLMRDIEEALNFIKDVDSNLSKESVPRRVILLMGQTKAGKTTLLYYLLGKRLLWKKNELDVVELEPESNYLGADVSGGHESTTVYPNIPPFEGDQETMVIDMPGFDDSRPNFRLLNVYILLETLRLIDQVHICSVISEESNGGQMLLHELSKICSLFNRQLIASPNCLSFVLTKVQDQSTKNGFLDQIKEFIEDEQLKQIEPFHKDFGYFLDKQIYIFYSHQPIVKEGVELKEQMIKNCNYQAIQKQPKLLLNTDYCKRFVGVSDLEQFLVYLKQLIKNTLAELVIIIQFLAAMVHFEYRDVFSEWVETQKQRSDLQLKERLLGLQQSLNLREMNKMNLIVKDKITINSQKRNNISKSFQRVTQEDGDQYLGQLLRYFSKVVQITKQGECHFSIKFMDNLELLFKNMSSLIFTLQQIRQQQIVQQMHRLLRDQSLVSAIEKYFLIGEENKQKVLSSPLKEREESLPEVQHQMDIEKVSVYSRIRNAKVLNAINKAQARMERRKENTQIWLEAMKECSIGDLSNNSVSLKYLKDQLTSESSQKHEILDKMACIFYRLSFLEESICFKMAIPDENGVNRLVKLGIQTEELSNQFISEVMIPYYCESHSPIASISMCYDYLMSRQSSFEKIIELQKNYLAKIENNLEMADNCFLLNERFRRFDFAYIKVILQNFEFYLTESERRQALYEKSCIRQLIDLIK